ncbi:MAG: sodium/proline symporter [Alphaproteobacteria bacterium]|nr:sodium/proline symporter [Alphaproteobacteria bacterium]
MSVTGLVLILYMLGLLGVGMWASRRAATQEDFLLGGRSLGPVVAGLAYAASTSSAWVLLGFTGFVATVGVSALWMVPGILAGYAAVWLWMGPFLQRTSRERGFLTALDFVAADTGTAARPIKLIAAAMIVFCFSFYIAAQFQGAGAALAEAFPIDERTAVIVGAGIILLYTLLGGFWAVSITDTLQGLSILLIAVTMPAAAFIVAGGVSGIGAAIASQSPAFAAPLGVHAGWSAFGFVVGIAAIGSGALGQPHLLTWIMAVKDDAARRQGAAVAIAWGALVYAGMSVIALSARALAEPGASLGETIVFDMAGRVLPGVFPALVSAAILSAIMSTVDAQLLVASATASHDLGVARIAPGREVLVTRVAILALCGLAVALTLYLPSSIFSRVLFAWTALGAAFGPTIVARVSGRRPHGAAILAAMTCGFGVAVLFNQFLPSGPGAWRERILPWVVGLAIVFIFSKAAGRAGDGRPLAAGAKQEVIGA